MKSVPGSGWKRPAAKQVATSARAVFRWTDSDRSPCWRMECRCSTIPPWASSTAIRLSVSTRRSSGSKSCAAARRRCSIPTRRPARSTSSRAWSATAPRAWSSTPSATTASAATTCSSVHRSAGRWKLGVGGFYRSATASAIRASMPTTAASSASISARSSSGATSVSISSG